MCTHLPTYLWCIALIAFWPRFQQRLHGRHGVGVPVPFQILHKAEDQGLMIQLNERNLVPPFVHLVDAVQRQENGEEEAMMRPTEGRSEAFDDLTQDL